jgi:hypothetical protein
LSLSGQLKLHALLQPILDALTRRTALTEKVLKDNILFGVPQMPKKSNQSILIQQQGFLQGRENWIGVCQLHQHFLDLFNGHLELGSVRLIVSVLLPDMRPKVVLVSVEDLVDHAVIFLAEETETMEI